MCTTYALRTQKTMETNERWLGPLVWTTALSVPDFCSQNKEATLL
jgi:hypothetical protein